MIAAAGWPGARRVGSEKYGPSEPFDKWRSPRCHASRHPPPWLRLPGHKFVQSYGTAEQRQRSTPWPMAVRLSLNVRRGNRPATPESAGPGACNFREQQGRCVGFSGAHIVPRRSQGLGVEPDLSAPRVGMRPCSRRASASEPTPSVVASTVLRGRPRTALNMRRGQGKLPRNPNRGGEARSPDV